MFINKKAQEALEFLVILTFVMVIMSFIMYFIGQYSLDLKNNEKELYIDDFADSILNEISTMQKVEGGYTRHLNFDRTFMEKYNISLEGGYLIIYDREYEGDFATPKYYEIPSDINITFDYNYSDINATAEIILTKNSYDNYDGLDLLSSSSMVYQINYLNCTAVDGIQLNHSQSYIFYNDTLPIGSNCISQVRTCLNGTLNGSFTHASCLNGCNQSGVNLFSGDNSTFYASLSGNPLCDGEIRSCFNGTLSGSFNETSCSSSPNLLAEYLFENSGNLGEDTSGNNYNLTLGSRASLYSVGRIGNGFKSIAGSNCPAGTTSLNLKNYNSITISGWIYPNNQTYYEVLAGQMKNTFGSSSYGFGSLVGWTNNLGLLNGNGGTGGFWPVSSVSDSQWHHLVTTFKVGDYAKLYLDGNLNYTGTSTFSYPTATYDFCIAGFNSFSSTYDNGAIVDNIRIYNKTLNSTEILNLYHEN